MTSFLGVPVDAAYHLVASFTSFLTPALGGAATVNKTIAATAAAPPRAGVRKLVNPETRW